MSENVKKWIADNLIKVLAIVFAAGGAYYQLNDLQAEQQEMRQHMREAHEKLEQKIDKNNEEANDGIDRIIDILLTD